MRKITLFIVLFGYCFGGEDNKDKKLERQIMGVPGRPNIGRQFRPTNPFTQISPFGVQNPFFPFLTPVYEYGACVLEPRGSGYNARGIIRFSQQANSYSPQRGQLEITVNINGLSPNTQHGFHIHQYGDLTNDCTSAGAHFNPYNLQHGSPRDQAYPSVQNPFMFNYRPKTRHVGDLGNVVADQFGTVNTVIYDNVATILSRGYDNIRNVVGKALVLHALPDDLGKGNNEESLVTGNTGGSVACCVIGKGNPTGWSANPPSTVTTNTQTVPFPFQNPMSGQPFRPYVGIQPQGQYPFGFGPSFGQQFPNPGEPNLRNSPLIPVQPFPRESQSPSAATENTTKKRK